MDSLEALPPLATMLVSALPMMTLCAASPSLCAVADSSTIHLDRRLAATDAPIEVWNNEVLKLDVNSIGLKGSPTWVSRIFSPQREKGEIVGDGVHEPRVASRLLLEKLLSKDLLTV